MKNFVFITLVACSAISCSGSSGNDSTAPQDQQTQVKCQDNSEWQRPEAKAGDTQSQKVAKFISANFTKVKNTDVKKLNEIYQTCLKGLLES